METVFESDGPRAIIRYRAETRPNNDDEDDDYDDDDDNNNSGGRCYRISAQRLGGKLKESRNNDKCRVAKEDSTH